MIWILVLVALAVIGFFFWKNNKTNATVVSVVSHAQKAVDKVVDVLDANNDGKVNFADVVTASSAIATEVVKDAELVKEKVKRGRKKYGGKVNLRFDDTNPTNEKTEYVDAIKRDISWLGYEWDNEAYYTSDYFDTLYG